MRECYLPGCEDVTEKIFCSAHWARLPEKIKARFRHYRTMNDSMKYAAKSTAVNWLRGQVPVVDA